MKDWNAQVWGQWLLIGASRASDEASAIRRTAFSPILLSPRESIARSVARYVNAQLGVEFAARDAGIVLALNHWTPERGGLPILLELTRRWRPIGAADAIVHVVRSGALDFLSAGQLDTIVASGFHTLAKLNDASAVAAFEAQLRVHEVWARDRHTAACLVASAQTSPATWAFHVNRFARELARLSPLARAEIARALAALIGLETFIAAIEYSGTLSDDVRALFSDSLRREFNHALYFKIRLDPSRATRSERANRHSSDLQQLIRVNSINRSHPWVQVPVGGLLQDVFQLWNEEQLAAGGNGE
ncbi:hypothetical protein [Vitreimonas flagellata]|uniref:hypothetical protein n=1 Tax=Vitreimonas flagellata TaxID=2560861 RepID=UPI001074C1F2|nr:hypothetical protein [Vitreimonas flagellata]